MTSDQQPTTNDDIPRSIWALLEKRVPRVGPWAPDRVETAIGAGGLDLDSVQAIEVIISIEDAFGVRIPPEWIEDHELTVAKLADFVRARTGGGR